MSWHFELALVEGVLGRLRDQMTVGSERSHQRRERNSISLLSNFEKNPLDLPSAGWLGHFCNRELVRKSGLWNQNHVDETYDPAFLDCLAKLVSEIGRAA